MKIVVQRVKEASVLVGKKIVSSIGRGMVFLVGIEKNDSVEDGEILARKVSGLRIFEDSTAKMNLSISDVQGEILAVSQFTLCSDCKKGRRPGFDNAMDPEGAKKLFDHFVECIKKYGIVVNTGIFQAYMVVNIVNDGPVTFIMDSGK